MLNVPPCLILFAYCSLSLLRILSRKWWLVKVTHKSDFFYLFWPFGLFLNTWWNNWLHTCLSSLSFFFFIASPPHTLSSYFSFLSVHFLFIFSNLYIHFFLFFSSSPFIFWIFLPFLFLPLSLFFSSSFPLYSFLFFFLPLFPTSLFFSFLFIYFIYFFFFNRSFLFLSLSSHLE